MMAKKKDFYNQSISGEDVELLAQFTGKLDKVLHNKRVSYLRKKNQKETKEVSFEANASYLEGVCRTPLFRVLFAIGCSTTLKQVVSILCAENKFRKNANFFSNFGTLLRVYSIEGQKSPLPPFAP